MVVRLRPVLVLTRLDQVRALADPLRVRLVESLIRQPASVAELSRAVRVPPTRLYHHIDLLVAAGLIEIVHRVRRRGAELRRFRAVAAKYTLDGSLLDLGAAPTAGADLGAMARGVLADTLRALDDGLAAGRVAPGNPGRGLVLQNRLLRLSTNGVRALARELPGWLDRFEQRHSTPRGRPFRLTAAAFPEVTSASGGTPRSPKSKE